MGSDETGGRIGPYEIVDRLGEGGMGVVYRGRDPSSGNDVAVKTARPTHRFALSSIRSEIAALARLHHPGIVRILGHGSHDGVPWYAMELLEGSTWDVFNEQLWGARRGAEPTPDDDVGLESTVIRQELDRTARARPGAAPDLPPAARGRLPEVLTLARRLCSSLAVLHAHGFVHRDLKPSNVFVTDGRPVVTDLGVAARFRGAVGRERIEQAGKLVGTVRYMAPEQARGRLVDARADLYAFGTMLYETITGRLPFRSDSVNEWLRRVLDEDPPAPSRLVSGLPDELEALLISLLAKRPQDRVGHADDIARILESLGAEGDDLSLIDAPAYLYRAEMAGRGEDLLQLEQAIVRASRGEGGVVLIGGESGVGKTFLASEAARSATVRHLQVVIGECLPLGVGSQTHIDMHGAPLHPVRPVLHAAADRARTLGEDGLSRLFGGDRAKLLSSYAPSLGTLPGVSLQSVDVLPGDLARQRLMVALTETVKALISEDGPLVLLIDDLQWVDDLTLGFLQHLMATELAAMKLLIVGTYRSDEVTPGVEALLGADGVATIRLGRLDEQSVGGMISDMLAVTNPPPGFVKFLAKQSEGNPFFVAEYLRLAAAERLLRRKDGQWKFETASDEPEAYAALALPASLQDLITRRIQGLSEDAQSILTAASVLGREFHRDLLIAVCEQDGATIDSALKELVARQVFDAEGDTFRFVHDKLRETRFQKIEHDHRISLSRSVAIAMETQAATGNSMVDHGVLAHFWLEARAWMKALDAMERAAEASLRDFSTDDAISTYEALIDIAEREKLEIGPLRRGRWERGLADAHLGRGRDREGRAHVERALVLFGQKPLPASGGAQALALLKELVTHVTLGLFGRFFKLNAGAKRTRITESAYIYGRLIEPLFRDNEQVLGIFACFRSTNLALRAPPTPALAMGYAMLSIVGGATPLQGVARRWALKTIEVSEQLDSKTARARATSRLVSYYVAIAGWKGADEVSRSALEVSRSIGDTRATGETQLSYSIGLYPRGRFDEQVDILSEALAISTEGGDEQIQGWALCGLGEAYARTGRDSDAKTVVPLLRDWIAGPREQAEAVWGLSVTSLLSLQTGDPDQARADADRAVALMRESPPFPFFLATALWDLAEVYLDLAEARADAEDVEARAVFKQLTDLVKIQNTYAKIVPLNRPYAKLAEAGLAWRAQKSSHAFSNWSAAQKLAKSMEVPHAEARAYYEIGRHQEGDDRTKNLSQAVAIYERIGARAELLKAQVALEHPKVAL